MEITAKELRGKPGQIIEQAARGTEVIITIHGKKMARLVPYRTGKVKPEIEDELFGLWKDRNDTGSVDEYVRSLRKGRAF
jgi:prevent-host-death family protein